MYLTDSPITGYRTNEDHTQTLAWEVTPAGTVACDHAAPACCTACVEADQRLARQADGTVTATLRWYDEVDGRTVRVETGRPRP